MSVLEQIRTNAAWVTENFGPKSGIVPFAYTTESVGFLDKFLDRQRAIVTASEVSINKFVHLLGAYLGECIIAKYGGQWIESSEGLAIHIRTPTHLHVLQPFHKVHQRIVNGAEDNLRFYFAEFIPQVLASQE
jgi:hypothetical protein